MKKVLIAAGVAVLAMTAIAGAAALSLGGNLSVGSTGADVTALQNWLIGAGYNIPSVASKAVAPGYFGAQTNAAVRKYQASVGLPSTGFVGPLTRAKLSGSAVVTTTPAPFTCPAGYTCTATPGSVTTSVVGAPVGISTPGVPGIMTVSQGPLSSTVSNVGASMVPVLSVRVQAQYSDLLVQSLTLDLGSNTNIYSKIIKTLYVTDGTNVLASQPLDSNSVVQSGSEYVVGLAGFNMLVTKGSYKDLVIKADLYSSVDSKYLSGGSNYPLSTIFSAMSYTGAPSAGWGVALAANSLRAVDGAGVFLYGPTSGFAQGLTINTSLVDTAQANISLNASSPLTSYVPVTDTTNGNILGLPVLAFDVNAQNDSVRLGTVRVGIVSSGTGSVSAAYLYQGSTPIQSASISNGVASFSNILKGTAGASVNKDQTLTYTVKVDVTGVTSNSLTVTASTTASYITAYNSQDGTVNTVTGSATGYSQTVASIGPVFALSSTPTVTKSNITAGGATVTTYQYSATFPVTITAVGTDINIGLPASTTAAFGTTTTGFNLAQIYQNGAATSSQAVVAAYSQPSGTTISSDNSYFTVARNQTVTVPVTYSFTVVNGGANTYAVQLQGVNWESSTGALQTATFMRNQPAWRTTSI